MDDENLAAGTPEGEYDACVDKAKKCFQKKQYDEAMKYLGEAVSIKTSGPEAYNIIGAVIETLGDVFKAQKYYRASLSFDPAYVPAQKNLDRTVAWKSENNVTL